MKFTFTSLEDVVLCEPIIYEDDRGYFSEIFRQDKLEDFIGYKLNFIQENESKSKRGVVRGLHYQLPPFAQAKLTRVVQGSILDIAVDIRKNSATFGKYIAIELSSDNMQQLYVPRGFAHGFIALEDDTRVLYKTDNYYNKSYERGIFYKDPKINIDWKLDSKELILSVKDTLQPQLAEVVDLFEDGTNYYD